MARTRVIALRERGLQLFTATAATSPECVCVCGVCNMYTKTSKAKRERHMRHRRGDIKEEDTELSSAGIQCTCFSSTKVLGQSDAEETVRHKRQSGKSSNLLYSCFTAALLLLHCCFTAALLKF